jgi:hypothetical protein
LFSSPGNEEKYSPSDAAGPMANLSIVMIRRCSRIATTAVRLSSSVPEKDQTKIIQRYENQQFFDRRLTLLKKKVIRR